jgi:hypothetical protein
MTTYAEKLSARLSALMQSRTADLETFAETILRSARENGLVTIRRVSDTELAIQVGNDSAKATNATANSRLRWLCARLATRFADGDHTRFHPYGALIECTFGAPRARYRLQLNFMNRPGNVWLELRPVPLTPPPE